MRMRLRGGKCVPQRRIIRNKRQKKSKHTRQVKESMVRGGESNGDDNNNNNDADMWKVWFGFRKIWVYYTVQQNHDDRV